MFNRDRVFRLEGTRQVHHQVALSRGGHGARGKGWKRQAEGGERYVIFPLISPDSSFALVIPEHAFTT